MKTLRTILCAAISATALTSSASPVDPGLDAETMAKLMEQAGMVDAAASDPAIVVDLMYARPDNFTGAPMYPEGFNKAYLHPDAAEALAKAQTALTARHSGLRLKVADAARPMSVQRKMYSTVKGTPMAPYVANPANGGGLHNYGLAVDITIVDALGRELPMGTPVDHLGSEANIHMEKQLVDRGIITEQERQNRILLRSVMKEGGFKPLRSEWWHFNLVSRAQARESYRHLDF